MKKIIILFILTLFIATPAQAKIVLVGDYQPDYWKEVIEKYSPFVGKTIAVKIVKGDNFTYYSNREYNRQNNLTRWGVTYFVGNEPSYIELSDNQLSRPFAENTLCWELHRYIFKSLDREKSRHFANIMTSWVNSL